MVSFFLIYYFLHVKNLNIMIIKFLVIQLFHTFKHSVFQHQSYYQYDLPSTSVPSFSPTSQAHHIRRYKQIYFMLYFCFGGPTWWSSVVTLSYELKNYFWHAWESIEGARYWTQINCIQGKHPTLYYICNMFIWPHIACYKNVNWNDQEIDQ